MRSLKYLNKFLWKYKWRLLLGVIFITISKIFAIYPAKIVRDTFDAATGSVQIYGLFDNSSLQGDFYEIIGKMLLIFGSLIMIASLINGFFLFLTRQTIIVMSRLIEFDLKNEIYSHYQDLSLAFYKRNNTGDLMNRISDDVREVRMYLCPAIMYTINLAILFVLVVATMINVNAELTLYCLLPLPILSVTIYYVSDIINKRSERVQRQLSGISTFVQEAFSGIKVIKAYSREASSLAGFHAESDKYKDISLSLVKVNALFHPIMILLIGFSTILTVYVGGLLTIKGTITTGNIAEFVIYVNMLTWPVAALGWVTSLIQRAAASQKRINEFLHQQPEIVSNTEIGRASCRERV